MVEKLDDRKIQSVADLLNGGDRRAVVSAADDIVQGRLRDPGEGGKPIDRDPALGAKTTDPPPYRFSDFHTHTLFLVVFILILHSFELECYPKRVDTGDSLMYNKQKKEI